MASRTHASYLESIIGQSNSPDAIVIPSLNKKLVYFYAFGVIYSHLFVESYGDHFQPTETELGVEQV